MIDIPGFYLDGRNSATTSPTLAALPIEAEGDAPSSRRTSFSGSGRRAGSVSGRSSSSGPSSRSTSFSLPVEAKGEISANKRDLGEEVEVEEMDPESNYRFLNIY